MDTTAQEAAQVLEDAADLLLIHGRCTGEGAKDDGRLCVRGAIAVARGLDPKDDAALYATFLVPAVKALDGHLATAPLDPRAEADRDGCWADHVRRFGRFPSYAWNDCLRDESDDFEVIDTLRLVAKDLRSAAVAS